MLDSVGFIGSGMMASALMDGLLAKKSLSSPASISCSDVWQPSLDRAAEKGYNAYPTNDKVCESAKTAIILAVKPNIIETVCKDIMAAKDENDAVIISIAAGVTLKTLEASLPGRRVIRVMPNTPCLVGEAAAGFALGSLATDADREIVKTIFGSVGLAVEVAEKLLDAVTGVSGSGPAYVFQFIEALSDGGVRAGLSRDVATKLAAQTVKGAAEMVLQTGKHPGLLKDGVTSPGGTTIAGVEALEQGGFRAATIAAVKAATKRSLQLGGVSSEDIEHKYNL
ncbi:hypothetical protein CTEN210_11223 [Chaetoceros tenuissimus]|uniref:Pyrroline-5-carboxylate reductase n=1 Tax=Chaetoceros tenuissimus TaxID=426638 RepID=A0AAD3CYV0_9STRA|nr:hypothetical protein CTEN210_11223 [Chaetoceros tenuissimus]